MAQVSLVEPLVIRPMMSTMSSVWTTSWHVPCERRQRLNMNHKLANMVIIPTNYHHVGDIICLGYHTVKEGLNL